MPKIPDLDGVARGLLQGAIYFALVCGRNVHGHYVAADRTPDESHLSVRKRRWTTEIRADLGFRIAFVAGVDRHEHHSRLCATTDGDARWTRDRGSNVMVANEPAKRKGPRYNSLGNAREVRIGLS